MAGFIVLVVVYVIAGRIDALLASVERTRLRTTVTRINTALRLEAATRLMSGDASQIAKLDGANPFEAGDEAAAQLSPLASLARRGVAGGASYAGALGDPDPGTIAGGTWYFDTRQRLLVYRVAHGKGFVSSLPGAKRARFRVTLAYVDRNANARFDAGVDGFSSVELVPGETYGWR